MLQFGVRRREEGEPDGVALRRQVADADGVCLAIDCDSFDEIEEHADTLKKGNFSICLPVKDPREGETLANRFNRLFFKP